jgi:hypothetical protein
MNLDQVTVPCVDLADSAGLWREAHLRDPAGNRVCLFHAGENRCNPPWRVGTDR